MNKRSLGRAKCTEPRAVLVLQGWVCVCRRQNAVQSTFLSLVTLSQGWKEAKPGLGSALSLAGVDAGETETSGTRGTGNKEQYGTPTL